MKKENVTRKIDPLGRVTIPKWLRDKMGLQEGDEVEFYTEGEFLCVRAVEQKGLRGAIIPVLEALGIKNE